MALLSAQYRRRLLENGLDREKDHIPVVKLFTPWANATWVLKDMEPDGDTCFGLCDLGLGEPELGYVSLTELESLRGPAGLKVEVDLHWEPTKPLSAYTSAARSNRRYVEP